MTELFFFARPNRLNVTLKAMIIVYSFTHRSPLHIIPCGNFFAHLSFGHRGIQQVDIKVPHTMHLLLRFTTINLLLDMKRCILYSRVKIVKVNHLPWKDPTKGFLVANICGRRPSMEFLIDTNRVMVDVVSRRLYDNYDVQLIFTAIDMQVNVTHV